MSRIARDHRILARTLVTAAVAALAATAPASASAAPSHVPHGDLPIVAKTCGGPNEIVQCKPPVKTHPDSPIDDEAVPTCGGPNGVVECPPPVEAGPGRVEAVRPA